jgi:D-alanyl-D-alanine carboxypeptidase/D-alanyl-D-alanine-endopeptidase (penicillin-binding protein 4)
MHCRGAPALAIALARAVSALAIALALAPPAAGAADLERRLDAALRDPGLRGARVAALVVDLEAGGVLYARDPDRAMVPASNQKVLTAIAALSAFGPAHRFTTEVLGPAPPDAEGAVEWLAIRGGGDPALTSEEVWRLAADLRRLGLRRVRAGLLLDDSAFDTQRWHPSWGPVSVRAYHAPVGALGVNYGAYAVTATPGASAGDPVHVEVDPELPYLPLVNRARTGPPNGPVALEVERASGEGVERVIVSGSLPAGSEPRTAYRSVLDPLGYAGAVIRMQLEANGIRVEGGDRRGVAPPEAERLLAFQGRPLAEIVRLFVKHSNNSIAEGLLKALAARAGAHPATWDAGLAVARQELAALGLPVDRVTLVDGSGLSYENRVPPRVFVEALRLAERSFRFGPEFVSALPIGAADGTLEKRAEAAAGAVRAKTGLLTRVTGLTGYARLADGRVAAFSVLANGYRGSAEAAMSGMDRFLAELVGVKETRAMAR